MKIAYCTIASANYLPRVKVLEDSLAAHNPNAALHILLCESPETCRTLSRETERTLLSPADVCADWLHMAFYYNIIEYNTALKPYLLTYLLDAGHDCVLYFDPDIEIFSDLAQLEALACRHDLILTPHICKPMPMDGLHPGIDAIIRAGQFNLGFIGLGESEETRQALAWWREVCREYCLFDERHRFFVDQFWAAALPSFIQRFYCLRDPGYNMAYWNVSQRRLDFREERWLVDSGKLKFFHFSGLSADLTRISRHQNRETAPPGSPLHKLLTSYNEKIGDNPWSKYAGYPYSFEQYADKHRIAFEERRMFLRLPQARRSEIEDPFSHPKAIHTLWRAQQQTINPSPYRKYFAKARAQGIAAANLAALRALTQRVARWRKLATKEKQ